MTAAKQDHAGKNGYAVTKQNMQKSIAIPDEQVEWILMDMEEKGIAGFASYVRWLIDKSEKESDRLDRIHLAIESGDADAARAVVGEIIRIPPKYRK